MDKINLPKEFYDNSKISDFRSKGDRYYFFRYERGWVPPLGGVAADWGTCWHSATEPLWRAMCGRTEDEAVRLGLQHLDEAISVFNATWDKLQPDFVLERLEEDEETEMKLFDKSPLLAPAMLEQYIHTRAEFMSRTKLLSMERPFVVPRTSRSKTLLLSCPCRPGRLENDRQLQLLSR